MQTWKKENVLSVSLQAENKSVKTVQHWQELQTLLLRAPRSSDFKLKQPAPIPLPSNSTITRLFQSCSSSRQKRLLFRHLLSSLALFSDTQEESLIFLDPEALQVFFPETDPLTFVSASWIAVPLLFTQGTSSAVLTLMLGLVTGKGRVFFQNSPCIDRSSRNALETVIQSPFFNGIGRGSDLLVWTLQNEDCTPLKGTSLGLSAAIGLYLLNNQKKWPCGFFASGEITREGHIKAVKHIGEKTRAISKEMRLFIFPKQNSDCVVNSRRVPVQTLKEAAFIVDCYQEGIHDGNSIALFQLAADDPDIFLGQFKNLPVEFFRLYDLSFVLQKIRQTPEKYIGHLATCLRENSYKIEQAGVLVSLFSCDEIQQFAATIEYSALKYKVLEYCLGALALYNHSGNIEESQKWSACVGKIATSMKCNKELSSFVNNNFVTERFNRYTFDTTIPAYFSDFFEHEEKLYELQGDDSWQLGAMYGTLAQNYGFCGPPYLGNLRAMVQRASVAFGRRYKNERSRLLAYLLYGLLDSHKFREAKAVLQQYLDLEESANPCDWLNKLTEIKKSHWHDYTFKTCLVCRFIAEQQVLLDDDIVDSAVLQNFTFEALQQVQHPWQLTNINLARLYLYNQNQEQAVSLLHHAISICIKNGETMQVMALLPLSLLHEYNLAQKLHYQQAEKILEMIRSNNALNQSHFINILSCRTGQSILEETVKVKMSLFPFSYR